MTDSSLYISKVDQDRLALDLVHKQLNEIFPALEENGLLTGKAGLVLFFLHYQEAFPDDTGRNMAEDFLIQLFDKLDVAKSGASFCTGSAGIGWLLEYAQQTFNLDVDTNEILVDLDEFLFAQMKMMLQRKNYDFLHGAIGIGLYFLKRLHKTEYARHCLMELISAIDTISITTEKGICWIDTFGESYGDKFKESVNLGVAHGVPGIVYFLLLAKKEGLTYTRLDSLIIGGTNFVLHQELAPESLSCYPNRAGEDGPSRLGWCYGDLGIGLMCYNAGKSLSIMDLQQKGIEIFRKTLSRSEEAFEDEDIDVCLCHGTAGISIFYRKMAEMTGIAEFRGIAETWKIRTTRQLLNPDFNAVWQKLNYTLTGVSSLRKYTLLEGLAGAGMSVLCQTGKSKNSWLEVLMLNH